MTAPITLDEQTVQELDEILLSCESCGHTATRGGVVVGTCVHVGAVFLACDLCAAKVARWWPVFACRTCNAHVRLVFLVEIS